MLNNIKLFCFSALVLCLSLKTQAQQFRGGVFLGFTASQIDGDNLSGYNRANLRSGVFTELKKRRRKPWTYGMELLYHGKGSNTDINEEVLNQRKIRLHYGELMPYAKYFISKKTTLRSGLALAYLFKADKKIGDETEAFEEEDFHQVNIDFNAAIATELVKKLYFQVDIQYSITPISKKFNQTNNFLGDKVYHNNIVGFSLYKLF
ncbi:MAG: outer membrane beta-barrel protein [Flavobacteriales bacterium]